MQAQNFTSESLTATRTAADVYAMQEALSDSEERFNAFADDLYWQYVKGNDTTAYLHDPTYVAARQLVDLQRQDVLDAQREIGGVSFRVANSNLDRVVKKLTSINRRAKKAGIEGVVFHVTDETAFDGEYAYTFVVVKAGRVQIAGWQFLAKLTVEPGGVLVSKVPAIARAGWDADQDTIEAQQSKLDAINLAAYANADTATECEHCAKQRRRRTTYVVENIETGEFKQVGSTCLRDFLGVDPLVTVRYAQWVQEIDQELRSGGIGTDRVIGTLAYLEHVCCMIRLYGWSKADADGGGTKRAAEINYHNACDQLRDKNGRQLWDDLEPEDTERATAALVWAREHFGAIEPYDLSDFDRNMLVAVSADFCTDRVYGILAYLPVAHARHIEREIAKDEARKQRLDEFYGNVGERVELELTVNTVFEAESRFGAMFITTFRDADGHTFKWFGSFPLERGATVVGKWTIKNHEDHEKYGKQTIITRPALKETTVNV